MQLRGRRFDRPRMNAREYDFSQLDQVMALYKYSAKKDRSVLPTVHMCGGCAGVPLSLGRRSSGLTKE